MSSDHMRMVGRLNIIRGVDVHEEHILGVMEMMLGRIMGSIHKVKRRILHLYHSLILKNHSTVSGRGHLYWFAVFICSKVIITFLKHGLKKQFARDNHLKLVRRLL